MRRARAARASTREADQTGAPPNVTSGIGIVVEDGSIRGIALPAGSRPGRFAPLRHTFIRYENRAGAISPHRYGPPSQNGRRRACLGSIRKRRWTTGCPPWTACGASGFRLSNARGARARFSEDSDRPFGQSAEQARRYRTAASLAVKLRQQAKCRRNGLPRAPRRQKLPDRLGLHTGSRIMYQSDITQFINQLKAQKPSLEEEQRRGRALLWDKQPIDLDERAKQKAVARRTRRPTSTTRTSERERRPRGARRHARRAPAQDARERPRRRARHARDRFDARHHRRRRVRASVRRAALEAADGPLYSARRARNLSRGVRRPARPAALPDPQAEFQRPRHSDGGRHRAVSRLRRPDPRIESGTRRRNIC